MHVHTAAGVVPFISALPGKECAPGAERDRMRPMRTTSRWSQGP